MKNFAIIGVAGYIAERHLRAIKETNNQLITSLDKNDSVGVLDKYFPQADFFTEYERFERQVYKLKQTSSKLDYISICTPNYLHDSHIRMALSHGANAICEKPLVLNPWNLDALEKFQEEYDSKIYNILQLRLHPTILALKKQIAEAIQETKYEVDLTYITSRGNWYFASWKANLEKSGGIASNIGIHFFDMLTWIFGDVQENIVHLRNERSVAGYLELENARVRWYLSIDETTLPDEVKAQNKMTYRSIKIDGKEVEFSQGFTDLHTKSYQKILDAQGFEIGEARKSVKLTHDIRNLTPKGVVGDFHPFATKKVKIHPFKQK